ncbi:MAG: hypothetical protein E7773_13420 [Sphingomonas sp.]|uniref:hypothetical protein n=1 Tax=Sphingomonas sp. TaxID=28214 RepID=UPI00120E49DD|nr:hypothetical protein [Sphingomonas sp.]THD35425.1 MAG: hypothetical protein E7773_13420 [Sphingomonas sp.]
MSTVGTLIERMMPLGTNPASNKGAWDTIPRDPVDVFAVTATLVERSGAYRYVVSPPIGGNSSFPEYAFDLQALQTDKKWPKIAKAWAMGLSPNMVREGTVWDEFETEMLAHVPEKTADEKAEYERIFEVPYYSFADLEKVDVNPLQELWSVLIAKYHDEKIVTPDVGPAWWSAALYLMILADMSCVGVGFRKRKREGVYSVESVVQQRIIKRALDANNQGRPYLTTIASDDVDGDFCAVLPKTRTASVGCTLRSLSHNLALLPSPGLVETHWRISGQAPPRAVAGGNDDKGLPLNLLLVPFPYRITSNCFVGLKDSEEEQRDWSFFKSEQRWLNKSGHTSSEVTGHDDGSATWLGRFVADLVQRAASDMGKIHGVVLPEYALDASTFEAIWKECISHSAQTGLEFIVAGLSEEPGKTDSAKPRHGNFVAVRGVKQSGNAQANSHADYDFNSYREKHHRWKLNKPQIERYSLSSQLAPAKSWWEAIPLGRRVVEFFEPRAGTSMTVLICEDLARSDPCQTVVRSIGPNLVLALLMDGPQRRFRWPGHYAGVLADDPGSSVLTMTSYGLIARGAAADESQSQSIAFFRNSLGRDRELFLPAGFHALAVSLRAEPKTEHTLDGRGDAAAAFIWGLHDVSAVKIPITDDNRWIVEGVR